MIGQLLVIHLQYPDQVRYSMTTTTQDMQHSPEIPWGFTMRSLPPALVSVTLNPTDRPLRMRQRDIFPARRPPLLDPEYKVEEATYAGLCFEKSR